MAVKAKLELISFKLCPYVQRAVILLKEKRVDFKVTYIDLKNKPEWFLKLSPLGRVPVLKVDDTVLFESAVIAEYLDETNPPSLHPSDPLQKATKPRLDRIFVRAADAPLPFRHHHGAGAVRQPARRNTAAPGTPGRGSGEGPFFNGKDFALVDAAFAPFFMRLALLEERQPLGLLSGMPQVAGWSRALLARPAVQDSVVKEFPELFAASLHSSRCLAAA